MKVENDWTPMSELEKIFANLTHSADKWRPYLSYYERYISFFKNKPTPVHLVEVGIQKGGSLEMWAEYFGPNAVINGIDIDPACEAIKYENHPNINITIGHQGKPEFWAAWLPTKPPIDVFIDDGSHDNADMIVTFENVFPHMPVGSIYVVEDCHSNYMNYHPPALMNITQSLFFQRTTFIDHIKKYVDVLYNPWMNVPEYPNYSGIHFHDSMVIVEKLGPPNMVRIFPKAFPQSDMLIFKT